MKIDQFPSQMAEARPILQKIEDAGYEAFFVGGAVRDMILGDTIHDVDIASSAFPQEIKMIFENTVDTGIQHGTVMVLDHHIGYEVTTFRTESTYTDYRRPDEVTFVRSLSEDLKRRDFTINALALKATGEVVDLFDGLTDLKNGLIRAVGNPEERFNEDALRIMRAIRFSAQLDFAIENQTKTALTDLAPNLTKIAVERIQVEFEKMLLSPAASRGLQQALDSHLLAYLPGGIGHWPLTTWQEILTILNRLQISQAAIAWTNLLVPSPVKEQDIASFLREWKLSRAVIKTAQALVPILRGKVSLDAWHLYQVEAYQEQLIEGMHSLGFTKDKIELVQQIFEQLPIRNARQMALSGQELMQSGVVKPGPEMGKLLQHLEKAVVTGEIPNQQAALLAYVRQEKRND
ncbi:CCA tRNA nucleotidyltransferase [Convivina intestini]|uniref:CCA tRNA nucleotidyltransferase n=1 Tax=Convivina intestini TaxID=1505726 RepID=UPI00200FC6DD|nr:CCA tRNA nucleotidyltransferase [Convivina intestini]CAH1852818.1 CCA-adding enzyme [Convivina intestini]